MATTNTAAATIQITNRTVFARVLRACRRANHLRAYGRLAGFGRSLITSDGCRVMYAGWTSCPSMNIHRG